MHAVTPTATMKTVTSRPALRVLRGALILQVALGLVWGISMLFFAAAIGLQ